MTDKPTRIMINDTEYIKKDSIPAPMGEKRIIVADRGWVFAGDCIDEDNGDVTIHNAQNIRKWGTSRGLGQLTNGPLNNTVLDPYGTVRVKPIVSIAIIKGW